MARLDAADIDIQAESADLREVVREVVSSMKTAIDDRPVEMFTDSSAPAVALDRRLVKLAIKQLVDNALKYSPPRTPVTLRVEGNESTIGLTITDRGEGIPAREQPRIFQ
jgi:signal transduction histidine kinase